jgi:hypothetical protein
VHLHVIPLLWCVRASQWLNECEVLSDPSLMWACWLLQYLLEDVKDLVPPSAIHDRSVFSALLRYLRTPGAPFKNRVISMITRLLKQPHLFGREAPDFTALLGIETLVLAQCERERASGNVFLPSLLQQLVEMCMSAHTARRAYELQLPPREPISLDRDFVKQGGVMGLFGAARSKLRVPVERVPCAPLEAMSLRDVFVDVLEMAECLSINARLPDRITCAITALAAGRTVADIPRLSVRVPASVMVLCVAVGSHVARSVCVAWCVTWFVTWLSPL